MKVCPKCKTEKDESEFFTAKGRPDGLTGYCKPCHSPRRVRRPKEKPAPEKVEQQQRERFREGKPCLTCKQVKPLTEFYVRGSGYFTSRCKDCERIHSTTYQRLTYHFPTVEAIDKRIHELRRQIDELTVLRDGFVK